MAKFPVGVVVATPGAIDAFGGDWTFSLFRGEAGRMLRRHMSGDWGDVSPGSAKENDFSVKNGFRILSSYESQSGEKIWIITEADRSATTFLLPDEY